MRKRRLLLVDVSNIAYKSAAAHPNFTNGDVYTGGLYGFMCAVAKAINATGATDICLCEDRRPYHRSVAYPEYKQIRASNKDEVLVEKVKTTIEQVRKLCEVTGWPMWGVPGFESDDLVAHTVIQYRHRYEKIIAMSNDSDLYQLFNWKHFQLYKGKKGLYTHEDFAVEWKGLPAYKLVLALSMTGTHNEVAGIKGVGPVTAIHALTYPQHFNDIYNSHSALIERNKKLISLPHEDFPVFEQMPLTVCDYSERKLMNFCARYKIQLDRWMSENFENLGGVK